MRRCTLQNRVYDCVGNMPFFGVTHFLPASLFPSLWFSAYAAAQQAVHYVRPIGHILSINQV
eukprot:1647847-Amphidinium_carterae.3